MLISDSAQRPQGQSKLQIKIVQLPLFQKLQFWKLLYLVFRFFKYILFSSPEGLIYSDAFFRKIAKVKNEVTGTRKHSFWFIYLKTSDFCWSCDFNFMKLCLL